MAKQRFDIQSWTYPLIKRLSSHRPPSRLPITISSKRLYVLPTRFGVFFGLLILIMLLGSLNYNNNMALMLTFLLGAFMLLIPIYTVRNLSGLEITHIDAKPVFSGDAAQFVITLRNGHHTARPLIWARHQQLTTVTSLPADATGHLMVAIDSQKRGWMHFERSRLYTTYPVGLFTAWAWLTPDVRCLVYPAPETGAPTLPSGHHDSTGRPEQRGDEEWSGLRDYQPGDPSRLMAWKVVARTGQLTSKVFSDHHNQEIVLDYHNLPIQGVEARLSRLCSWIIDANERGLHYALQLPDQQIQSGHGDAHMHHCLQALAEFQSGAAG